MALRPSQVNPVGRQFRPFIEKFQRDSTEEALSIVVNPTTGRAPEPNTRLVEQHEFTTEGAFNSVASVCSVLPTYIGHTVTLTHADGAFSITPQAYFGDFARFRFGATGQIVIKSESGVTQVDGTSTMGVASSSGGTITLDADPSIAADTYAMHMLKVTAGTGAGQVLIIESHTGTTWQTVGDIPTRLDATSEVQVVQPAAVFTLGDHWFLEGAQSPRHLQNVYDHVRLNGLGFTSAGKVIAVNGLTIGFVNVRLVDTQLYLGPGSLGRPQSEGSVIASFIATGDAFSDSQVVKVRAGAEWVGEHADDTSYP